VDVCEPYQDKCDINAFVEEKDEERKIRLRLISRERVSPVFNQDAQTCPILILLTGKLSIALS